MGVKFNYWDEIGETQGKECLPPLPSWSYPLGHPRLGLAKLI